MEKQAYKDKLEKELNRVVHAVCHNNPVQGNPFAALENLSTIHEQVQRLKHLSSADALTAGISSEEYDSFTEKLIKSLLDKYGK